jgi:NAD(P)-dependent dehydrogenase (short-subunit alcohol dehydrogenase family)
MTALEGADVLVTGGSRGIGKALVEELHLTGQVLPHIRDHLLRPASGHPALRAGHRAQWRRPPPERALRALDGPRSDRRDVAALALGGIETGAYEVLADEISRQVKAGLAGNLAGL